MQTKILAAMLTATTLLASSAFARESVPILNQDNISVTTTIEKTPTAEQVRAAIMSGAQEKGWVVVQVGPGKLQGTLLVRGKHTVVIDIPYSPEKYALIYKDSQNMNYHEKDGQKVIHPFFNRWLLELKKSIELAMQKL